MENCLDLAIRTGGAAGSDAPTQTLIRHLGGRVDRRTPLFINLTRACVYSLRKRVSARPPGLPSSFYIAVYVDLFHTSFANQPSAPTYSPLKPPPSFSLFCSPDIRSEPSAHSTGNPSLFTQNWILFGKSYLPLAFLRMLQMVLINLHPLGVLERERSLSLVSVRLAGEGVGLVSTEDEDMTIAELFGRGRRVCRNGFNTFYRIISRAKRNSKMSHW